MIVKNHFIVRQSSDSGLYYIDYHGWYTLADLHHHLHLDEKVLHSSFEKYSTEFKEQQNIYLFSSKEKAQAVIDIFISSVPSNELAKAVYLTEQEIEIIRKALINEDNNFLTGKKASKDEIFRKLNSNY